MNNLSALSLFALCSRNSLCTARNSLCTARNSLCAARNSLCTARNSLCTALNSLCIARNSLCAARNSLCTARNSLGTASKSSLYYSASGASCKTFLHFQARRLLRRRTMRRWRKKTRATWRRLLWRRLMGHSLQRSPPRSPHLLLFLKSPGRPTLSPTKRSAAVGGWLRQHVVCEKRILISRTIVVDRS